MTNKLFLPLEFDELLENRLALALIEEQALKWSAYLSVLNGI